MAYRNGFMTSYSRPSSRSSTTSTMSSSSTYSTVVSGNDEAARSSGMAEKVPATPARSFTVRVEVELTRRQVDALLREDIGRGDEHGIQRADVRSAREAIRDACARAFST